MREHTKSRRGCLRCKRRKVKCDETLPSCRRCTQRGEICSYVGEFGVVVSSPGPSSQHASPALQPLPLQPDSRPNAQSYLVDLDLTHQYLTCTYSTLWGSDVGKRVWRDIVFQMALANPTILAGLLATAAMHRTAMSRASPELENIALRKQTEALEGLRLGLENVSAENCDEVFVLSTLVSFWSFASRNLPERLNLLSTHAEAETGPTQPAIGPFIELLRKVRCSRAVTREAQPWLQKGRLTGLLRMPGPDELPELSDGTKCALAELEYQLRLHTTLTSTSTGHLPTFTMEFMFRVSKSPDFSELLVGWPAQLSDRLIEDFQRRDHAALTLLAYWAVCFDVMNSRWWSTGWSKALVHEISNIVQGPWLELLHFPKAALETSSK